MTQPPPYGVPPQQGYPQQAYPQQGYPQQGYPPQGYPQQPPAYGPVLPPPPPSKKRTVGFVVGLITAIALIGFVVVVWLITAG